MDVRDLVDTSAPGESPLIDAAQVQAWEAEAGALLPGDVLLLRCDWDDRYLPGAEGDGLRSRPHRDPEHPGLAGTDPGHGDLHRGARGPLPGHRRAEHRRCRRTASQSTSPASAPGLVYLECLANLAAIPTDDPGASFFFAPIKVRGGTGAPGRAFVIVPRGAATGPDTAGEAS